MKSQLDDLRDRLSDQVLDATTLPEIHAAQQALRAWIKEHPEDEGMRDGFEQLSLMQDIAEQEEAEGARSESLTAGRAA
ncbi:MAG: hypothetical protein JO250_08295 [Armatimonadetes bacterium]|nr:hypothetical protein [Armatimonadota bacterium]